MTNREKIETMTMEELTKHNVRPFSYMNGYRPQTGFLCSDSMMFDTREEAEEHEFEWLNNESE